MDRVTEAGPSAAHRADESVDPVQPVVESGVNGLPPVDLHLVESLVVALVAGAGLAITARVGATALLVAIAVVQAALAVAWVLGTAMPGRRGGLVTALLAGAGSDVCVSVWPHGRLGSMVAVVGLAVGAMFVHQLARGASRRQIVSSLSAASLIVVAEAAVPALLALLHEFAHTERGGLAVEAVVLAAAGGLVVGYLVDLLAPRPRLDPEVPRGVLALLASVVFGGLAAYLVLRDEAQFPGGSSAFLGAAIGALTGLLSVGAAFVLFTTPEAKSARARSSRPVIAALLPLCVVAPAAFLLCLAVRS